jgi:hypothetical protein
MRAKIDVAINVCGKVHQTALALLTLERHSGQHIDRIYFVEENTAARNVHMAGGHHEFVRQALAIKIDYRMPPIWNYCFPLEPERLGDEEYRHAIRYQYAWEATDKDFLLVVHNDSVFHGDVVGAMLRAMDGHIAIGPIGQCWYCPAAFRGLCGPERYAEYRPSFEELAALYRETEAPEGSQKRAYHLPRLHTMFLRQAWPLPECRVNEWCALIDMRKARPITAPRGRVTPFGAILDVGKQILDVGCQWFREVHVRGHTCAHFDVYRYMHHDVPPTGQPTLLDKERSRHKELQALERLRAEFGHP